MPAKKRSPVGEEEFQSFLARLDARPEEAGISYGRLHRKLQVFFETRGFASEAADLADETIDRVIRKLADNPEVDPSAIPPYAAGFARKICHEQSKKPRTGELDTEVADTRTTMADGGDSDDRIPCLRRCLFRLSEDEYQTIVAYYCEDKGEKIMMRRTRAVALAKSRGALAVQVYRIRQKLAACMTRCLTSSTVTKPGPMPDNKERTQ